MLETSFDDGPAGGRWGRRSPRSGAALVGARARRGADASGGTDPLDAGAAADDDDHAAGDARDRGRGAHPAREHRPVGAKPAAEGQGMASTGDTFRDEVPLFLRGFAVSRPTVVEVSDDLVSMVRVLPD